MILLLNIASNIFIIFVQYYLLLVIDFICYNSDKVEKAFPYLAAPIICKLKEGVTMPEESKISKAQQKAVQKYVKNNYDRVVVTFPKGRREEIKTAATAAGESVNGYIKKAVDQRMERESNE